MKDEIRYELEKWEKHLRRYCHQPNCVHIYKCPRNHKKCYEKLGLDTAIAWTGADILNSLRLGLSPVVEKTTVRRFHTLSTAVLTDFNNKELCKIMEQISEFLTIEVLHDDMYISPYVEET